MILKKLELGPFATNCYVVGSESGNEGMIIDPADDAQTILSNVKDSGLDIKSILLTHGHLDHIGALKAVKEATGAEVIIHSDDAAILQDQSLGMLFGLPYRTPSLPDRLLKDGDSMDIGDLHFQVLHTPGHTPGGICLQGHGIVFSGDTLFNYGIGRADLPGGNHSQLVNSIHRRLMVLPDDTIIYPGHGPDSTIGAERQDNPFLSDQSSL
jgi:glyoxylase-like metal-dependent hydrolase (beta-lactamase superfamily II)|tara:strand:- start:442 stop:1074 length:633 start_codon:yes stop_codon:yes gene_type:complete